VSSQKHKKAKTAQPRWCRIVVSAGISLLVCALVIAGDCLDIIPGYLTLPPEQKAERLAAHTAASSDSNAGFVTVPTGSPLASSYGSGPSAPAIDRGKLKKAISDFTGIKGLGTDYSLKILDPEKHVLAQAHPDTPREPASTTKTVTALAAAAVLDMNSTLDTRVFLMSTHGSGKKKTGTIVLRGQGDMLLGAGQNDPTHVDGRAGLATLAAQTASALRSRSISSVNLTVDDRFFGPARMPRQMNPNYVPNGLFTPTSSLAIDEGKEFPASVSGNPDGTAREYAKRPLDVVTPAAATFAAALGRAGINVTAGNKGDARVSASTTVADKDQIAVVHSAPLWEVLRFALHLSDNTIAEEFGRLVAKHESAQNSPAGAVSAVMSVVKRLGVDLRGVHLADCSGLSDGTRLTVNALTQVQYLYLHQVNAAAAEGLAVSGLPDTTLAERRMPRAGNALIRAKTGSLDKVMSLAGTAERKNGGYVIFAVIVNNAQDKHGARVGIDNLVTALTDI
jgi:D-alanyl-D-alanine carboxypeptidase/D-alanyl-D-alanine-endopeptidase (penicillin-binding protein 4)